MRRLRKTLGCSGIVAAAMVIALVGCGGSATSGSATEGGSVAEEETVDLATQKRAKDKAKAEEAKHWVLTEEVDSQEFTYTSTDMEGNTSVDHGVSNTITTYELDDHGNVTKMVEVTTDDWGDSKSSSETTSVYTRDENGWPTKIETTESRKTSYDDGTGQMVEQDDGSETTEVTYTYEYDDEGRVIKATSSDEKGTNLEYSYYESGEIATCTSAYSQRHYSEEGNEFWVSTIVVDEYAENGIITRSSYKTEGEEGLKVSTSEATYDADGSLAKRVTNYTYDDDTEGVETTTFTNERNEDGFVTKRTVTIEGDGKKVNTRWVDDKTTAKEIFMADGSIQATTVTRDENYEETEGETKTYDGPYYVLEQEFDEQGNLTLVTLTYYDGSVNKTEYTYDEDGNTTKEVWTDPDGSAQTYVSTYDENGNRTSREISSADDDKTKSSTTSSYTYIEDLSDYQAKYKQQYQWIE